MKQESKNYLYFIHSSTYSIDRQTDLKCELSRKAKEDTEGLRERQRERDPECPSRHVTRSV